MNRCITGKRPKVDNGNSHIPSLSSLSVDVLDGCAAETVRLAGDLGVNFVPAGATFPYGRDPRDRNLRLAPTMPSLEEVENAMEVFCVCAELASIRKLKEESC